MKKLIVLFLVSAYLSLPLSLLSEVRLTIKIKFAKEKQVLYITDKGEKWLRNGDVIPPEGEIRTENGRCVLVFPDGSEIKLLENSVLKLDNVILNKKKNALFVKIINFTGKVFLELSGH